MITIRIRGPEGVTRIKVEQDTCTLKQLYETVAISSKEVLDNEFYLAMDPQCTNVLTLNENDQKSIKEYGFKDGEILFLKITTSSSTDHIVKDNDNDNNNNNHNHNHSYGHHDNTGNRNVKQLDPVDEYLSKQDGRIKRKKDPQYCKHGDSGMCLHCQPLEPYDQKYADEKGIKHLSFHAYLCKIGLESNNSKKVSTTLEEPDYRVKKNCPRHAPYPAGICSLCQPSAISLNSQPFRMTDHVEFETPALVESFLARWRQNGYQCFGWLYGRYEAYDEEVVPLGIKAVIMAIYEPPQDGSIDGFALLEDEQLVKVDQIAEEYFNLKRVGMIYTDLADDGTGSGKVTRKRGADTFFLSSNEILFAAEQQKSRPSPFPKSPSGHYGSKFVTLVLSGDEANDIGVFAYQVSLQAVALVEADLVLPTTDPSLMMVKSPTLTHYIPEVLYSYKNQYGSQVSAIAKPTFPVDYLLLSLSYGFPRNAEPTFKSQNYPSPCKRPTKQTLLNYLLPLPSNPTELLKTVSSFNLFIHLSQLIPEQEELQILSKGILNNDPLLVAEFIKNSKSWTQLLDTITTTTNTSNRQSNSIIEISDEDDNNAHGSMTNGWACPHCTFINTDKSKDSCKVCGLPRDF